MAKNIAIMDGYFDREPEYLILENGSDLLYNKFVYEDVSKRMRYFYRSEKGLGWALKEGIRNASCNEIFFLPADLSYDLSFVKEAKHYLDNGFDIVLGSKALATSTVLRPLKREIISGLYNGLLRFRYGPQWPFDITGVKAYKKWSVMPLLMRCKDDGIHFEVELMREALKDGLKTKEIAVIVNDFRKSHFLT